MGLGCPLFLMLSGGGLTTLDTAARFPIRLVESGPAGGAIFSAHVARQRGLDRVLSFDMGGTTAKVCLIDGGRPQSQPHLRGGARRPVQEGLRPAAPHPGDRDGGDRRRRRLARRPRCDGPHPGGAGKRGRRSRPGLLRARRDAAGGDGREPPARPLRPGALRRRLHAPRHRRRRRRRWLRMSAAGSACPAAMAALGVVEVVDEAMANAARVHAVESGKGYDGRAVIAFGGGGPVHACRVAEKLGVQAHPGAERRRRRQRHRLPARARRLRGGAQPLPALRHLRPRGGERAARRDGGGSAGGGGARRLRRAGGGAALGVHALCRPGPRDRGGAAAARPGGGGRGGGACPLRRGIHPLLRPTRAGQRRGGDELRRHRLDAGGGGGAGGRCAGRARALPAAAPSRARHGDAARWRSGRSTTARRWRGALRWRGLASWPRTRPARSSGRGGGAGWTGLGYLELFHGDAA